MKKIYIFLLMFGLSQHSMFAQNWNFNWGGIGSGSSTETNSIFNFNFNNIDFSNLSGANFNININLGTNTNFGNFDFSNININNCCVEQPFEDISFGYDIGAALAASALIQEARDRDLNQWFDRQHTVLKEEIERQLGQSFSDYNDARNTYFKFHERIGIHGNHIPIENKYNTRRLDEENKRSISVRNLKLLRLRENELRTGNINNSSYGNFSYNGTSLDQVQSLSQLQSLWRNEYSTFSNVQLRYHNDYYTYLKIRSIGYITNYNDPLVVSLFNKQLANYNRYDRWKQLDLMQAYLNKIRPPLALPSGYISPKLYATPQYLENYAISHKGGGRSVFDPYYNMYGPFYQIWLAREDRQEARSQVNRYIRLRKNELNNLLNEVEVDWVNEIINELTGKAKCIYDKLQSSSTGFKNAIKQFDGEFPVSHLSFKINNTLSSGNYGITNPPSNYNITVEFSNTQLGNISDLGSAVAFAHEIIHAEIFRKMLSAAKQGDLDPDNMTQQQQVNYVNSLRNNFPGIYDYYIERYKPTWNHNQIASHYRGTIADIIEEFDDNSLSRQIYEDIAWAGLRIINNPITNGTETSIAWDNLSIEEKTRVTSNLSNYFHNGTKNCN